MAAAGVRPIAWPKRFEFASPLEQDLAKVIEQEDREGSMQFSVTFVSVQFLFETDNVVTGVDEHEGFVVKRHDCGVISHSEYLLSSTHRIG